MNDDLGKTPLTVKDTHGLPFTPLSVWAPPPPRRPVSQVPGGRRPLVAILDTGVADHPWFRTPARDDPILVDARAWQWPDPPLVSPFRPEHGTFVAGLVRQNSPDATILSVPLLQTEDGHIASGQIRQALQWLYGLVPAGEQSRLADVVCVAIGFRSATADNASYAAEVEAAVRALGDRGTLVVAAAGNHTNMADDHVYPAALLATPSGAGLPLVAVGATDADGVRASFSVAGDWVTNWYVGVDVMSTTPIGDPGAPSPPDDFCVVPESRAMTGFGRGSGTSYAAAGFAGSVAQAMLDHPDGVREITPAAAMSRARRALTAADRRT